MKKRTIAILAIAVLALGAVFIVAQRAAHKGSGFRGHREIGMALRALDLTDDQKAKVKEIFEANKGTVEPIRESMKANHEKLANLNGSFDEAQVSEIAKNQGELTAQLIVARERVKSQIFALLTDEQKAKAAKFREGMKQRFQERRKGQKESGDAPEGDD
jgi:Spy/CpxP family protein refolding chaperone